MSHHPSHILTPGLLIKEKIDENDDGRKIRDHTHKAKWWQKKIDVSTNSSNSSESDFQDITKKKMQQFGIWSVKEHKAFQQALDQHGRDWIAIAKVVGTRNIRQVLFYAY